MTEIGMSGGISPATAQSPDEAGSTLAALLSACDVGIMVVRMDDVIVHANQRVVDLLGLDAEPLSGRAYRQAVFGSLLERVEEDRDALERPTNPSFWRDGGLTDEITVRSPIRRLLERSAAPIHMADGAIHGRVELYKDVSETRELQQSKDRFLALVSHELRTPVTSIKGYVQLLQRRAPREGASPGAIAAYQVIERQVARIQATIDMLLDVSRLESGSLHLSLHDIDVKDLVYRVTAAAQMTAEDRDIEIRAPQEPIVIRADADRLEQVFQNLLSNAIRYSATGSAIAVKVRARADTVDVVISDLGVGIPKTSLPRLFERFHRVDGASESSGIGVGLYISNGIVQRHGGCMRVDSELGVGSTFTVTLPRV